MKRHKVVLWSVFGWAMMFSGSRIVASNEFRQAVHSVRGVPFEGSPQEELVWNIFASVAAAYGVTVKLVDTSMELGFYAVNLDTIIVSTGFGQPDIQLYVLAHEVGHVVAGLEASSFAMFFHSLPLFHFESVCSDEEAAWHVARGLLEKFGWDRWNRFEALRELALSTYRCL